MFTVPSIFHLKKKSMRTYITKQNIFFAHRMAYTHMRTLKFKRFPAFFSNFYFFYQSFLFLFFSVFFVDFLCVFEFCLSFFLSLSLLPGDHLFDSQGSHGEIIILFSFFATTPPHITVSFLWHPFTLLLLSFIVFLFYVKFLFIFVELCSGITTKMSV